LSAQILSGKEVAAVVRGEVADRVADLADRGKSVGLATVLVGDDPASQGQIEDVVRSLNSDPQVDGMIVQLPLPPGLDANRAVATIDPQKDADGLHPHNLGLLALERGYLRPATPSGIMRLLQYYEIETSGKIAVIVGRSFLVGKPMALLLGAKGVDATVVQAHSRTRNLAALTGMADILVAAIGNPRFIKGTDIKPGAVVIDVGVNRVEGGLVGDVDFESAAEIASAITPVPGGVGLMTVASLLANTVGAAERATS
jgi:methylenetetrahydrofolate dehydrogenase (NADP+)/methenyltetrahydrofolate cyclohydrolase